MGAARKPRAAAGAAAAKAPRGQSVTLVRGAHRWTFSCGPGEEAALLDAIAEVTQRPGSPIDRFDLSIVGQQLNRVRGAGSAPGAASFFPKDPPPPALPNPPGAV